MKRIILLLGIFLMGAMSLACAPKAVQVAPVKEKPAEVVIPLAKEGWKIQWERTLALAKKEGVVSLYVASFGTPMTQGIFRQAFTEKYGIKLEWTQGRAADVAQKIVTERRNGLFIQDISVTGGNPSIPLYKARGLLQPLPPNFILPEVGDPSAWLGGKLPFIDLEGLYVFAATLYPQSPLIVNTKVVRKEEFTSYKGLLDPKWKGKFVSNDPTQAGSGLKWFMAMMEEDFGPILGLDYMRSLANQNPVISRDMRLAAEWLIKEKYPFGLNLSINTTLAEYKREGIPLEHLQEVTPEEGGYLTGGGQIVTYFNNPPHPNASRVFLNWLLSREGTIAITKATIKHSTRTDIPDPREIDPYVIAREPGKKYVIADNEKYLLKEAQFSEQAKEIFGHLLR